MVFRYGRGEGEGKRGERSIERSTAGGQRILVWRGRGEGAWFHTCTGVLHSEVGPLPQWRSEVRRGYIGWTLGVAQHRALLHPHLV